jgi:hypothetical protein
MAAIRLILLMILLTVLILLLVQNWSPVLSLVFLGMRAKPLPLALWILFSIAAGAGTSSLITILLRLANFFAAPSTTPAKSPTTSSRSSTNRSKAPTPPSSKPQSTPNPELDDWETNRFQDDDWDLDAPSEEVLNSPADERQPIPKSSTKSGSVYSYSYQEPKNTAVGKTESVYDADYRVIIPPYQPPTNDSP